MRTTFKVSFYLRSNYENKEGKSPVMLRVFLNGEMANFGSTKIFVDKTVWNNATSRLKGRTAEALSANAALDSISATLNNIYHKYEDDSSLSLEKIRSYFVGKDREYTTFLPVFDRWKSHSTLPLWPNRIAHLGHNMIDPFGPNNINHLVQLSLEFFCVDLRTRVLA